MEKKIIIAGIFAIILILVPLNSVMGVPNDEIINNNQNTIQPTQITIEQLFENIRNLMYDIVQNLGDYPDVVALSNYILTVMDSFDFLENPDLFYYINNYIEENCHQKYETEYLAENLEINDISEFIDTSEFEIFNQLNDNLLINELFSNTKQAWEFPIICSILEIIEISLSSVIDDVWAIINMYNETNPNLSATIWFFILIPLAWIWASIGGIAYDLGCDY